MNVGAPEREGVAGALPERTSHQQEEDGQDDRGRDDQLGALLRSDALDAFFVEARSEQFPMVGDCRIFVGVVRRDALVNGHDFPPALFSWALEIVYGGMTELSSNKN